MVRTHPCHLCGECQLVSTGGPKICAECTTALRVITRTVVREELDHIGAMLKKAAELIRKEHE